LLEETDPVFEMLPEKFVTCVMSTALKPAEIDPEEALVIPPVKVPTLKIPTPPIVPAFEMPPPKVEVPEISMAKMAKLPGLILLWASILMPPAIAPLSSYLIAPGASPHPAPEVVAARHYSARLEPEATKPRPPKMG
jgi:hypothetical protein